MLKTPNTDGYLNLLVQSIPASTPERNNELVMKFWGMFPTLASVKNMTANERAMVAKWDQRCRRF